MAQRIRLFVYGTLMRGQRAEPYLGATRKFLGERSLIGSIYHLGGFPGVKLDGRGEVHGHMFEIDKDVLSVCDGYEGYRPQSPETSLYIRRTLTDEEGEYFTYEYNRDVNEEHHIESGRWVA